MDLPFLAMDHSGRGIRTGREDTVFYTVATAIETDLPDGFLSTALSIREISSVNLQDFNHVA